MRRIRVLVVHSQPVARRRVALALGGDPLFLVTGGAPNGRIAVAKAVHSHPDVIVHDPDLDPESMTLLQDLRKTQRGLLFFAYPTVSEPAAPSEAGELLVQTRLCDDLVPKILAAVPWVKEAPQARPRGTGVPRVDVVAIGVSTGGPNALASLVPKLPADLPVPIVVVQHMPPLFTRLLAERLTNLGTVPFVEGVAGMKLEPGKGYIAPGDFHMTVVREGDDVQLALNQDPPENSCRPAVDVLFRSVADAYGPHALAVVLTGMGSDGLRGIEVLRSMGVRNIVQDEKTSVVWGMPGAVAKAGLADQILPLDDVPLAIVRGVREGRSWNPAGLASMLVADAEARQAARAAQTAAPTTTPAAPLASTPSVPTSMRTTSSPETDRPGARSVAPSVSARAGAGPAPEPTPARAALSAAASGLAPAGISSSDFDFVSKFIYDESAIVLEVGKEYLVESRLITLARKLGMRDIPELVDKLRSGKDVGLERKVVEAMTTNETSFFRDV
ncbi:MAG: Chemotaxis response regulator protein-glutamate methylesterase, partial [Pseudomonadota bacterium]